MEDLIQESKVYGLTLGSRDRGQSIDSTDSEVSDTQVASSMKLHSNVRVTFHQRRLFMETFSEYFADYEVIEKSLSPEANHE